jgi:Lrp/AsnC family transcriptional regulator, leucine-responsive regulatory protein
MDHFDRKLLNLVQLDADATAEKLSEFVPLSPSAITRRLKRMRETGAISHTATIVSSALRQSRITAVLNIQLDRHTPSELGALKRFLADAPEVQVCMAITGTADMLVIASLVDMAHFNAFADSLAAHPMVRRYETSFMKREIKMSLAIDLLANERQATPRSPS